MKISRDDLELLLRQHERITHKPHQLDGVFELANDVNLERGRIIPGVVALFDEVGAGKSKQTVDTAQILASSGEIDTVLVLAPGFARSTWAEQDPLLGEVAKHCWGGVLNIVHEFHSGYTELDFRAKGLHWVVTNYELIRRDERLAQLSKTLRGRKVWIVADESWFIKGRSDQTRAACRIRKRCVRATILNGTPLSDGKPMDLFYQFYFLSPDIIGCKNATHFKSKYTISGGFQNRSVVGYKDLDELNRKVAPYILARKTRDFFELPEMMPPIYIDAPLEPDHWAMYKQMRDDMVAWLGGQASMSKQGITKALRLAQICAGFLGGLEDVDGPIEVQPSLPPDDGAPPWVREKRVLPKTMAPLPFGSPFVNRPPVTSSTEGIRLTKEVGREKLDATLQFLQRSTLPDQMLIWCRFKLELARTTEAMKSLYPMVANLKGGQSDEDRKLAKQLLAPGSTQRGAVVGNPRAGGASLNFSAANLMIFQSLGPRLIEYTQSVGRIERPGATRPMQVVFVRATGPKGQKTVDHHTIRSVFAKEDMASWSVDQWRQILSEE